MNIVSYKCKYCNKVNDVDVETKTLVLKDLQHDSDVLHLELTLGQKLILTGSVLDALLKFKKIFSKDDVCQIFEISLDDAKSYEAFVLKKLKKKLKNLLTSDCFFKETGDPVDLSNASMNESLFGINKSKEELLTPRLKIKPLEIQRIIEFFESETYTKE